MIRLIPPQAYWIAIAALILVVGTQHVVISGVQTELAQEKQARSAETAVRERVARQHVTDIAALQAKHASDQQSLENDYAGKIKKLEDDKRAGAATAVRLRDIIAAFGTIGRRPGETDTAAGERAADRLKTVSGLLAESVDLVTEGRTIVERRDAEVGRLLDQIKIDRAACTKATS